MAIFRPAIGGTSGSSRPGGTQNTQCIPAVNPADSGTPSLTLQKIPHSRTASWQRDQQDRSKRVQR